MNKLFLQGISIVVIFIASWKTLQLVDWLSLLKIEEVAQDTEEKLGELFVDIFTKSDEEIKDEFVLQTIDSLVSKVCANNKIDRSAIKLHVIQKDEVNAFALPDNHLIIYSQLILESANEEELLGVIGHEIAHIESRHVMKKLIKEVGLAVLISATTGNSGTEVVREIARTLSSTAFDRQLETEADQISVDYMINSDVDPRPFADFLYRLADANTHIPKYLNWISTHPDSKERAESIIAYCKGKEIESTKILTQKTWTQLQAELAN